MIAADTNVIVRLLVEDEPRQASAARVLLESSVAAGEECFVSDPVLCELEWVLESCSCVPRAKILGMMQELVASKAFSFESREVLRRVLDAYAAGKGNFSDYLIGGKARARGATGDLYLRPRAEPR